MLSLSNFRFPGAAIMIPLLVDTCNATRSGYLAALTPTPMRGKIRLCCPTLPARRRAICGAKALAAVGVKAVAVTA